MKLPSQFPEQVWDGVSPSNDSILNDKSPDYKDRDQLVAELIALQSFVIDTVGFLRNLGGPNSLIGVNADGISAEYKTLVEGTGVVITYEGNQITISATGGGGEGSVTSVDASGGETGLSFSGGPIVSTGTLTLAGILNLASGGTGANTPEGARTNLELIIGQHVQAYHANLAAIAGLTPEANTLPYFTSETVAATTALTDFAKSILDDVDAPAVRATISAVGADSDITNNAVVRGKGGGKDVQSSTIYTDDNGRLIVGNPTAIPHADTTPTLQVAILSGGAIGASRFSNDNAAPTIRLYKSRGTTIGAQGAVTSETALANLLAEGSDGTNPVISGYLQCVVDGPVSAGIVPSRWEIVTGNSSGIPVVAATFDSSQNLRVVGNFYAANLLESLTANRTYYVRTDGSDSNDGFSNTSGGAFLTLQKAMDVIAETLDLGPYNVTVQIGDGTYGTRLTLKSYRASTGIVTFQGNATTPTNVLISTTTHCIATNSDATTRGFFTIKNMDLTTSGGCGLITYGRGCIVLINNVGFRSCSDIQCSASDGAVIGTTGNLRVSGGATVGFWAARQSHIKMFLRTITYSGTVAYSARNFTASEGGLLDVYGMTFTNGGIVTGTRFLAAGGGLIFTNAGGANYVPGNVPGVADTANGGFYY